MKITKLHLRNYQQFRDLTLDFTHPKTGKPLDRVCFIGKNGTGKTTILELLNNGLTEFLTKESFQVSLFNEDNFTKREGVVLFDFKTNNGNIEFCKLKNNLTFAYSYDAPSNHLYQSFRLDVEPHFSSDFPDFLEKDEVEKISSQLKEIDKIQKAQNVLSFIVSEGGFFEDEIPKSSVDQALKLFHDFPEVNLLSNDTVHEFWTILIYHIKKREDSRNAFENLPENLERTKKELIEEFDDLHPQILIQLAEIWNKILKQAGLYFDHAARSPVQLTDNLFAHIKFKSTGETIPYNKLSSGIKNFIFRLGHLYSLYFNRKVDNGFLLIDEPENSLYPDFLYNLMEVYEEAVNDNTQIFVATHNPIIAAQFEPYERFILDFDEEGYVTVKRGTSPIGDDPNDILEDDFLVQNIMPKQGLEAWNRYKNLKREIRHLSKKENLINGEKEKLESLIGEMSELGSKYNF